MASLKLRRRHDLRYNERMRAAFVASRFGSWVQAVACGASLLLVACGNDHRQPIFETTLTVENASNQPTTTFITAEPVRLVLHVRNLTDAAQTLTTPSGQLVDFWVRRLTDRAVMWRFSDGMAFPQVVTTLAFAPREVQVFPVVWDQRATDGGVVRSGDYQAEGFVATAGNLAFPDVRPIRSETSASPIPFSILSPS
ncbi:MAG: hypothetical protein A2638_05050 [Nitrospirae bacterium RIFCSPHIGHO2_01_FULL_66_17]|nr:MAG: hypothetical protein A2638_05050 [Nitrospirae bacterium RIFCSPHIGHO2_01_FULL_66_17]